MKKNRRLGDSGFVKTCDEKKVENSHKFFDPENVEFSNEIIDFASLCLYTLPTYIHKRKNSVIQGHQCN